MHSTTRRADEIEYEIIGNDTQAVTITLDPNEQVIAEAGAMLYMTDGIDMQTTMAPGGAGFFGSLFKAVGRMIAGEGFFVTTFANNAAARAEVSFAAPYSGRIVPIDLREFPTGFLAQKDSFLCAARGVDIAVAFTKKIGAGLFGGEGFVLQRLSGDGLAFVHAGGTVIERKLEAGQRLRVDPGCLVGFDARVSYNIKFVGGFKNALFGGEGLWFATVEGPGIVYLQTLPFSRLADRIASASRSGNREQGPIRGQFIPE